MSGNQSMYLSYFFLLLFFFSSLKLLGGGRMVAGISFFIVSSSDLKYKLMRHVTLNPLLFWISPGLISCIFI